MKVNTLGRSGLNISEVGFGGAPLGNLYQAIDNTEALATVSAAYAGGVRYFDTAPLYGHGLSERRLGCALAGQPRDSYLLSSKVGRLLRPQRHGSVDAGLYIDPPPFTANYDYSYDGTWRSIEDSLQRLGSSYLDLVFIHDIDGWTHGDALETRYIEALEGSHRALVEMREQGIIAGFGLGVNEWPVCERFARDGDPDCFLLAGRYTLLEQDPLDSFLPLCAERDISVIIGGPYNTGILATGAVKGAYYDYAPAKPEVLNRVAAIERVCADFDVTLAAAALRFPLGHSAVAAVIPGARSIQEVTSVVDLIQQTIPADFWQALIDGGHIHADSPLPL